jgi:GTP-binding protein
MNKNYIRNIAIVAHVDHGKTTLVDKLLAATNVFRQNQDVEDRVLDSDDQERERGITITSKNISIKYKDYKINIIDTPGHADFGGEVERVLSMADAALLIVDAFEGPMPQTRFVLKHALECGLKIIVVVNKCDRKGANPNNAIDQVFDLMIDLGANDSQLEFPIIYTSALDGYARYSLDDDNMDMIPLLDMIIKEVPAPRVENVPHFMLQVSSVDFSTFVGRVAIGRIKSGKIRKNQKVFICPQTDEVYEPIIKQIYVFENLDKKEVDEACAGDIVALVGIVNVDIGDCVIALNDENSNDSNLNNIAYDISKKYFKEIKIEPPTMSVIFEANSSPLVGLDGDIVGARQLKERLLLESKSNISMKIEQIPESSSIKVSGRGVLHLSVLMEAMRREGFEFQVGRPEVIVKYRDGQKLEPIEEAVVDVDEQYSGKVIEIFGSCGAEMSEMFNKDGKVHIIFNIPSRGTMGLNTKLMNATHGSATLFHHFDHYGSVNLPPLIRKCGSLISISKDKAVAYALDTLQQRGVLFVKPGDMCYEGMIVGQSAKEENIQVNVAKSKHLGNQRASGSDKAIELTPPKTFTLEEALEYIDDTELVEVTPKFIRLRKRILSKIERKRAGQL